MVSAEFSDLPEDKNTDPLCVVACYLTANEQYLSDRQPTECTATLSKLLDFSGFEHCWKHLGSCKYTAQQNT